MKKLSLLFAVAFASVSIISCEKIEKALFKPFESPLSFEVTIPVISNTTSEVGMGQTNVRYNLDSVIRKNTGDVFGADMVGAMYINQVGIEFLDGDGANSLANFDYVKLSVSAGNPPAVFGPFAIPAGTTFSKSFTVDNSPNIKPYFSGSTVTFSMSGKANKATVKELRARISATLKFEK